MTLAEEILNNWNTDIPGYAHTIDSLEKIGISCLDYSKLRGIWCRISG